MSNGLKSDLQSVFLQIIHKHSIKYIRMDIITISNAENMVLSRYPYRYIKG